MKFNINDNVKVKLKDRGREILKDDHDQFVSRFNGLSEDMKIYRPKKEDSDGWSTWQLWTLMETLGPYIHIGFDPPFEPNIEICTKEEI